MANAKPQAPKASTENKTTAGDAGTTDPQAPNQSTNPAPSAQDQSKAAKSDAEKQATLDAELTQVLAAEGQPTLDEIREAHANAMRHIGENERDAISSKWDGFLTYEQGVEAALAFVLGLGTGKEVDVLDEDGEPTGEQKRPGANEAPLPESRYGLPDPVPTDDEDADAANANGDAEDTRTTEGK